MTKDFHASVSLQAFGAAQEVTGSNYLLTTPYGNILVDCGLFQGSVKEEQHNADAFEFDPKAIDFMILTHAHIDHSGRIPKLVKEGFRGKIICSRPTRDLAEILLLDAAKIQEADATWENKKRERAGLQLLKPLYNTEDAQFALAFLYPIDVEAPVFINEKIQVTFRPTGHLLGACSVTLSIEGRHVTFSGDMGTSDPILYAPPAPMPPSEVLICEATYGNSIHNSSSLRVQKLIATLDETLSSGGTAIIPAFSVGRTQQLLYDLYMYLKDHPSADLHQYPIYVDSPLAIDATQIYKQNLDWLKTSVRKEFMHPINPFMQDHLTFVHDMKKSIALNANPEPKIIISASGMCDAGRIRHHLKHYLWQPKTTIIFVGYQAQGSLGRAILEGKSPVTILDETIAVKARIVTLSGYSVHGDQTDLTTWIKTNPRLKKILLTHGEPDAIAAMKQLLEAQDYEVIAPKKSESVTLW